MDVVKKCNVCGEVLNIEKFSLFKGYYNGAISYFRRNYCRQCEYEKRNKYIGRPYMYSKEKYDRNKVKSGYDYERNRKKMKEKYIANRDELLEKNKNRQKRARDTLADEYILKSIKKMTGINVSDLRKIDNIKEIMELKRVHLTLTRKINNYEK